MIVEAWPGTVFQTVTPLYHFFVVWVAIEFLRVSEIGLQVVDNIE
jgi:hypothetical protein